MTDYYISKAQARHFLLLHHCLGPYRLEDGKEGISRYFRHVGCIQYDPLRIAGHNHELVLNARIPGFRPSMVRELLYEDRTLVDGWDKNMSLLRTEDWPYFARLRKAARTRLSGSEALAELAKRVLGELERRGPLSSLELEGDEKIDWAWAPARAMRAALESLYYCGAIAVHHRVHTRRYYDLAERLLPAELLGQDDPNPDDASYHDWYVHRRIGSAGLLWNRSGDGWLGISGLKAADRAAALSRLLSGGRVAEVSVEGISRPLYIRRQDTAALEQVLAMTADELDFRDCPFAAAIAPLDNLIWERQLTRELFGLDYKWEVYKPVADRSYGYYVLPLLYKDRFAARFEPVFNRSAGVLEIKGWWWEPGAADLARSPEFRQAAAEALEALCGFLGASSVRLAEGVPEPCGWRELWRELQPAVQ